MSPAAAKRLAREHGLDLWWDRNVKVWTITVLVDPDCNKPAEYLSAGSLRSLTPARFTEVYLDRADAIRLPFIA